ncbi:MAG: hypothetical protein ACREOW_03870, partial [Thermodesulfobacteriota bacterium]
IVLTDTKQHKEPFTTFFSNVKEVRHASAHFGIGKASIWRSPQDWLNFADLTSGIALTWKMGSGMHIDLRLNRMSGIITVVKSILITKWYRV